MAWPSPTPGQSASWLLWPLADVQWDSSCTPALGLATCRQVLLQGAASRGHLTPKDIICVQHSVVDLYFCPQIFCIFLLPASPEANMLT